MTSWKKIAYPHFPKKEIGPPIQKVPKIFEIFPAPDYKTQKNKPLTKKNVWVGGVYAMENKDTNTDYQKLVSLGDQKWEIIKLQLELLLLFLLEICILYFFIQAVFKSHLKKITPTQSANSSPKPWFDLSPSYINVLKNGSTPPPPPHHPGGGGCKLCHIRQLCIGKDWLISIKYWLNITKVENWVNRY